MSVVMKRRKAMAIGRRKEKQSELFIPTTRLARGLGHPFYTKLNEVVAKAGFDEFVEKKCAPYYKEDGRPGNSAWGLFSHAFHRVFRGFGQSTRYRLAMRR